jgi:hypothetical protein
MEEAEEFGLLAAGYCAFIETSDDLDRDRFVRELERHLVDLYSAAIDLPRGGGDEADAADSMTSGEWQTLLSAALRKARRHQRLSVDVRPVRRRDAGRGEPG